MAANTPLIVSETAQQGLIEYHKQCYNLLNQSWNIREQMRQIDLAFIREQDYTVEHRRAQLANRYGDSTKFQNVTVPIVLSAVETAVTYQASVFLTGNPIFGVVASPQFEDEAGQMQAIIEENSIRGGWVRQYLIFFKDLFKYNLGFMEVAWDRVVTFAVETDLGFTAGRQGKPKQVIWEGNCLRRWDPYNTFFDARYLPCDIPTRGEFIGKTELYSRVELKTLINQLPDKILPNVIKAFETGSAPAPIGSGGIESYYIPRINPDALIDKDPRRTTDWLAWASLSKGEQGIAYKNLYEVTTLYARIIPNDFNLNVPSKNTPQVWKLIIVNHQVVIYAERQTNAHEKLPVMVSQAYEDGLGYQTKSLGSNVRPFQDIGSALVNSAIAARRRSISDRGLYDPSRVTKNNIESDNPSAKIPVRPSAYGKPLNEAYYPIPFRDDQSSAAFQEVQQMMTFAQQVTGQNPTKQGQFVKGNKTNSQFDQTMSNANGRDQTTSMLLEANHFTPVKEMLKINILQYQAGTTIYSPSNDRMIKVDPIALRKAIVVFKVSDGLTPTDKLIEGDTLQVAMQAIASSPQIGSAYNLAPLFSYLMKTKNADLKPFEKSPQQIAYEQAMGQWNNAVQQIATMAIKAGQDISNAKWPPQPTPEQYGYQPQGTNPTPQQTQPAPGGQ
jgi:hypothetical protein